MTTNDTTIECPEWCDGTHADADHQGELTGGVTLVQIGGDPIRAFLPGSDEPLTGLAGIVDVIVGLAEASRITREGRDE